MLAVNCQLEERVRSRLLRAARNRNIASVLGDETQTSAPWERAAEEALGLSWTVHISNREAIMDLLKREDLESLSALGAGEPQISLFMPTHRFGTGVEMDKIRWRKLVTGVEKVLQPQLRRSELEAMLAPARRLQNEGMKWQYMSDGLAMFLRRDWHRTYRVPADMPSLATVGDRLVLGPMLRLFSGDAHFFVLALSQREIRLLEGSRNTVEEVQLASVPTSLEDAVEAREPRSDTMARPAANAGRRGPAVFYGHGAGDQHVKKDEVMRFLREVSTELRDVLGGQTSPMVLVGLGHLVAAYREVNAYGHLIEDAAEQNPDPLSIDELHRLAWPIVDERLRDERGREVERFHALHGTGRASSDLRTVAQAAAEARVETLFVKAQPWCWERVVDDSDPVVRLGTDQRYADCE